MLRKQYYPLRPTCITNVTKS